MNAILCYYVFVVITCQQWSTAMPSTAFGNEITGALGLSEVRTAATMVRTTITVETTLPNSTTTDVRPNIYNINLVIPSINIVVAAPPATAAVTTPENTTSTTTTTPPAKTTTTTMTTTPEVTMSTTAVPTTTTLPTMTDELPKTLKNTVCDQGWDRRDFCGQVNCYQTVKIDSLPKLEYVDNDICARMRPGSHLVSIHCDDEMNYVKWNEYHVLTGFYVPESLRTVWDPNSFQWTDGSPVDYVPWAKGKGFPQNPDTPPPTFLVVKSLSTYIKPTYLAVSGGHMDMINIRLLLSEISNKTYDIFANHAVCKKTADFKPWSLI